MSQPEVFATTVGEAFRPPADPPARKRNRLALNEYVGTKAYSLTLATAQRQPHFKDEAIVDYCIAVLRETSSACHFDVYAFCFMPDHLHLLVAATGDHGELIDFIKRFKQKTGFWFTQSHSRPGGLKASPTGGLWQRSYYDHVVRSEENLRQAAEYILANPVTAGLADDRHPYRFAGSFVWPELNPVKSEVTNGS